LIVFQAHQAMRVLTDREEWKIAFADVNVHCVPLYTARETIDDFVDYPLVVDHAWTDFVQMGK
jgi:hypothetical protein